MDKYTWHAEPHMTEIDICRNENSGNEIIFVVERIDEARQACKELNDLQHHLTQAYEVVTAQARRIQELEAEREAERAACDGMTPDGLHAWIKEVTADYAKLRPHSIRRASSGKIVDSVLERLAELEALLLESESADTTADDVNAGTVDVFAPIANGEVCAFCYHSFDDPCQNHPVCQTTGNPYPEHDTQPRYYPVYAPFRGTKWCVYDSARERETLPRFTTEEEAQKRADELNATPRVNGDGDGGAK